MIKKIEIGDHVEDADPLVVKGQQPRSQAISVVEIIFRAGFLMRALRLSWNRYCAHSSVLVFALIVS